MSKQLKFLFVLNQSRFVVAVLIATVISQSSLGQESFQAEFASISIPSSSQVCSPVLLSSGIESIRTVDYGSLTTKQPVIRQSPMVVTEELAVSKPSSFTVLAALTDRTSEADFEPESTDEKTSSRKNDDAEPADPKKRKEEQRDAPKIEPRDKELMRNYSRGQKEAAQEERSQQKRKRQQDIDKRSQTPNDKVDERQPASQQWSRQPKQPPFPGRRPGPLMQPPIQRMDENSPMPPPMQFDVVSHPVFKQMMELMKENFELRAKLEVQQIELKAERAISELKLNFQRENLENIERNLAEQQKEISQAEGQVEKRSANGQPRDAKEIRELEMLVRQKDQEIEKLKNSLLEAKQIAEVERVHAEQARSMTKELKEALEDCQDDLKKAKAKK